MTFNNTYYALKSNTGRFMAVVYDKGIHVYDEELSAHNLESILFEHKEDAQDFVDVILGSSLIKQSINYVDGKVEFDKIVEVTIDYGVTVNEFA